ncbi:hypothetical protein FB45DRAFT_478174 [Roridomyces roridus]|uniref:Acetoacetate decarboxylase n=1 Tax=Roridomyces roridus TaxID=1738132 RepID=A0AAD7BZH5_9AGAR|nr:hypothetical protein FB45DRAFT_478174 [Roridomyces roridus]
MSLSPTTMTDIPIAPAPWNLKGRSWIFPVSPLSAKTSFPAGWCSPFQAEALASGGEFIGGLGLIQVVSYSDSPVGPYDELIYVPGRWKYPNGSKGFRITQIYVSSKASTLNGRKNWNIPKQVANFEINTSSDGTTNISVSHTGSSTPFFQASVQPITLLSSLAIRSSTSILGSYFSLMQPPLPAGTEPEVVETTEWASLTPVLRGATSLRKATPGLSSGKVGDGLGFPAVAPWSVAFLMEDLDIEFGVPTMQKEI